MGGCYLQAAVSDIFKLASVTGVLTISFNCFSVVHDWWNKYVLKHEVISLKEKINKLEHGTHAHTHTP